MAKELTEQEKSKIKDAVIASCISKGIKPMVMSGNKAVPNPLYASCIQLGYNNAIGEASRGKLGLWFTKVNSFVQSQGGVTGLLQSVSSIANQYRGNTPNMTTGTPQGYVSPDQPVVTDDEGDKGDKGTTGMWLIIVLLLIVLIIATFIYFKRKGKT